MTAELHGTVYSPGQISTRAQLVLYVEEKAAQYFNTKCIAISLENERFDGDQFVADYTAWVYHDVESKSYGPGVCRGCGKQDWPQDRLNEKRN